MPGKTRGEVAIEFIETWKAAGIPAPDILRAMTTNGYKVRELEKVRGPIKVGLAADLRSRATRSRRSMRCGASDSS